MAAEIRNAPTEAELWQIARKDPRVGAAVLRSKNIQAFTGKAHFIDGAVGGNPVPVSFDQIPVGCYVYDWNFQASRPNYALGNILRPQAEYYNAKNPGVDARLFVTQGLGPSNYLVNISRAHIEQICRHVDSPTGGCCSWAQGWVLYPWQTIQMETFLTRSYTGEGELPLDIDVALPSAYFTAPVSMISIEEACTTLASLAGIKIQDELPGILGKPGEGKLLDLMSAEMALFHQYQQQNPVHAPFGSFQVR